jgi:uncharacterized protein (DUF4415 family)
MFSIRSIALGHREQEEDGGIPPVPGRFGPGCAARCLQVRLGVQNRREGKLGMKKKRGTTRRSAAEIAAMRKHGQSRTDWRKVDAMSEADLARAVAADPDDAAGGLDWTKAVKGLPPPKQPVKLRIDADVLAWFRATGKGYQTRMNNVLRAFVETRKGDGR